MNPVRVPDRRRLGGIALVVVLWMLALLSVIAGSLVFSSRTDLLIAGNFAAQASAEAAADAGVYKAIHELTTRPPTDPESWRGDGATHQWAFADALLEITIFDESAKIDINTAPDALLQGLFRSLGRSEMEAENLADAVLDWRDPDDLRRLHGAEKEDYAAAGRTYGPANANFEAIEELRQVLGIDEQLYLQLEPLVTVHSGQPGVNSSIASRQVLLALPGATPELVDPYLELRRVALEQRLQVPMFSGVQGFQAGASGSTYTIQVRSILSDNTRFFREAVVQFGGNQFGGNLFGSNSPVTVLAWRTPLVSPSANQTVAPDTLNR